MAGSEALDCIVVGARCAGVPLAMHLTRAGMRVRVLEATPLGTGQPFSTHAIQPPGMDSLDALGVGDAIRAVTPPVTTARLDVRDHFFDLHLADGRAMYCPRRSTLDPLLQRAGLEAGIDIRERTRVVGLLRDGERVCGVEAEHDGKREPHRARWVVGADGRNSTVARLVGAPKYIEHTTERGGYWGYWPKPACWDEEEPWARFQTVIRIDDTARFVFECDDDLLIMGALPAYEIARTWPREHRHHLRQALAESPLTEPLCRGEPVGDLVGLLKGHFYFREAVGDGWALVGDAGLHKDPTPGHGITDALRDAAALAQALVDGRPEAMEVYWRQRDVDSVPLYFQGLDLGRMAFVNPFSELFMDSLQRSGTGQLARMREVIERQRSPFDAATPLTTFRWLARGLLEGRRGLLPAFAAAARYAGEVEREMKLRRQLLDRACSALG